MTDRLRTIISDFQSVPPDLRLAAREVQYCQEGLARVTCN